MPSGLPAYKPRVHSLPAFAEAPVQIAVCGLAGLGIGALTSIGQKYLNGALNPIVNSASAWLVAPFVVGSWVKSYKRAALMGLGVALAQLVGYYLTAHLRGHPAGGAIVLFWSLCAFIGGPLFGAGGHFWRTGDPRCSGLGSTLLPAAFLAEGLWVYLHELHYHDAAALWTAIGLSLLLFLPDGWIQRRWILVTLSLGVAGEILLTHVQVHALT